MKVIVFIMLAVATLGIGCRSGRAPVDSPDVASIQMPSWSFLASVSAQVEKGRTEIPRRVYVFPALRLNDQGQPIEQLAYREDASGRLLWSTSSKMGNELKSIIEKKLSARGFSVVSFDALTHAEVGHAVLVLNPYYKDAAPSSYNQVGDTEASWTVYTRIDAATFPLSLNPQAKREVLSMESISLFNRLRLTEDVTKRSASYLIEHLGRRGVWSQVVSTLN
jgi:hypothetical protein